MPVPLTAPGVYIEEVSSGVRTITNVATSVAAFVGYTSRGIDDRAKRILSFADFDRGFGGLAFDSEVSYAVQQFFQNGGAEALVVRVSRVGASAATMMIRDDVDAGGADALRITALSKGEWGNGLLVDVDYEGAPDATTFNLTVTDTSSGTSESFTRVSIDKTRPNFVQDVVNDEVTGSKMIKVAVPAAAVARPAQTGTTGAVLTLNAAGQPTGLTANKTLNIKLVSDVPSAPSFPDTTIELLKKGDPIPTTVQGVCSLLEQQINRALAGVRGTSVRCVPATTITPTTRDVAIRVIVTATDAFDAVLEFKKGTTGGDNADADAGLHLKDGTANVGHYWMGATRAVAAQRLPTAGAPGGTLPGGNEIIGDPAKFTGIYALDKVDLFNILCIPDATRARPGEPLRPDLDPATIDNIFIKAAEYLRQAPRLSADRSAAQHRRRRYGRGVEIADAEGARQERRRLLSARAALGSPEGFTAAGLRAMRGRGRALRAHRRDARRVEGASRSRSHALWCAEPDLCAERRRKRRAQSAGIELPAGLPGLRRRVLGRADADRRRRRSERMEIRAGEASRAVPRGELVPRHQVGGVRAE